MPHYDYLCKKCNTLYEIRHEMSCEDEFVCPDCNKILKKQISSTFYVTGGMLPTLEDHKEEEHHKKVKDPERARRQRRKVFGADASESPNKADPKHIVKRGKVLAGQQKEIDKHEFIKSASKSDHLVKIASDALKKRK